MQIADEVAEQEAAPSLDEDRQEAMKENGGNYLITGTVTNIDATKEKTDEGRIFYSGIVNFSLNIIGPRNR